MTPGQRAIVNDNPVLSAQIKLSSGVPKYTDGGRNRRLQRTVLPPPPLAVRDNQLPETGN